MVTLIASIDAEKAGFLKKGFSLTNVRSRSKIQVKVEDWRPLIDISLNFKGSLVEYRRDTLNQPQVQKKIEKHLARPTSRAKKNNDNQKIENRLFSARRLKKNMARGMAPAEIICTRKKTAPSWSLPCFAGLS